MGINEVIGQMGNQVYEQGGMVERIDHNLSMARRNMEQGNEQLESRRRAEEGRDGDGEEEESWWSISGKINKAMMFFFVLNIVLIVVWFLKHI